MEDAVFNEHYLERVKILCSNAHMQGQAFGIENLFILMKDFEDRKIPITVKGLRDYMEDVSHKVRVAQVLSKAEETIKKVEQVIPPPDNVVQLFGKKNANTNV